VLLIITEIVSAIETLGIFLTCTGMSSYPKLVLFFNADIILITLSAFAGKMIMNVSIIYLNIRVKASSLESETKTVTTVLSFYVILPSHFRFENCCYIFFRRILLTPCSDPFVSFRYGQWIIKGRCT